jgi:outer membrane lipoprotein SlyB
MAVTRRFDGRLPPVPTEPAMRPLALTLILAGSGLALAGCVTTTYPSGGYGDRGYDRGYAPPAPAWRDCRDCGRVERIVVVEPGRSAPNATGAILGGIVGAIAGHEISDHTGGSKGNQNIAAAAGAVAGAVAGNAIQDRTQQPLYDVYLQMDDGRRLVIRQRGLDGIGEGAPIRLVNGRARLR